MENLPMSDSSHEIIPSSLAIKAMRDSGYRDSAHAIAELVDNSIQADASDIEVICIDKLEKIQQRTRRRIDEVLVYDNGKGMSAEVLRKALQFGNGTHPSPEDQKGIGKFGMGLPNSSISQCERVEVWTWQKGKCIYSYLDVEEIRLGKMKLVPEPVSKDFPNQYSKFFSGRVNESGTLVVWSRTDRIRWKTSKALLTNSSLLIGRMYRYFINDGTVKIRLAAYTQDGSLCIKDYEEMVLPNDPLYLMQNTSCPPLPTPYETDSMFEEFSEPQEIKVTLADGSIHDVIIRYSIVRTPIRKKLAEIGGGKAGNSPAGKHAAKNIGVSVVRAGRELEMNRTFDIGYDPVERWWGIEVSFSPALDDIFGVTNNKQAANAFRQMDLSKDAEDEGMSPGDYKEQLLNENDPRLAIYEISRRITGSLGAMRKQLSRMSEESQKREISTNDPAEVAATNATKSRKNDGYVGDSDSAEEIPASERKEHLAEALEKLGADPKEAKEIAIQHIDSNLKYYFQKGSYDGYSFFSVSSRGGTIIVTVNETHPAAKYLYGLLDKGEHDNDGALTALKTMLFAWARMEDEAQSDLRKRLADMRSDWGRIARDFLNAAFEVD